jgi:hypothetical protein
VPARSRVCEIAGCGREHASRGLCSGHYGRLLAKGDPQREVPLANYRAPRPVCAVEGCSREVVTRGWCAGHYSRWIRAGDVQADRPLTSYRRA